MAPIRPGFHILFVLSVFAWLAGCAVGDLATAPAQERSFDQAVDDIELTNRIRGALKEADRHRFARVGVEVVEARALLTGIVKSTGDRIEAARIAWNVDGIREVHNETQITSPGGPLSSARDSWITTRLRTKLATDPEVTDVNFTIDTVNRVVYLMGLAQDEAEIDHVLQTARGISGVERVVNYVRLKSDDRRPE